MTSHCMLELIFKSITQAGAQLSHIWTSHNICVIDGRMVKFS